MTPLETEANPNIRVGPLRWGRPRSTQRRLPTPRSDQENLTQAVINLAEKYGRCGYLRITALRSLGKMSSFRGLANRLALFSL